MAHDIQYRSYIIYKQIQCMLNLFLHWFVVKPGSHKPRATLGAHFSHTSVSLNRGVLQAPTLSAHRKDRG